MKIQVLKIFHLLLIATFLTACGSSGGENTDSSVNSGNDNNGDSNSGGNNGGTNDSGLPSDIKGLIALNTWSSYSQDNYKGIYVIDFSNGQVKKHSLLTTPHKGINPYVHDRQTITYAEPCYNAVNFRTKIINEKGISSAPILPCTTEFDFTGYGSLGRIKVAKYSPNRSKVALEVYRGAYGSKPVKFEVKVFDVNSQKEIETYTHFISPDWNRDGSLLLSTSDANPDKGIYIVDKDFSSEPERIDQGVINQSVSNIDISPSGDKLIFSMSGRIWMMSIDNNDNLSNLQEIINEGANLNAVTWSPDGKYIAYLSFAGEVADKKITFWQVASQTPYIFDTKTIFPLDSHGLHWMTPSGYLSWVK